MTGHPFEAGIPSTAAGTPRIIGAGESSHPGWSSVKGKDFGMVSVVGGQLIFTAGVDQAETCNWQLTTDH